MKQIEISQEDFDFLKELQHELNTQTSDGNADPVYWGVMETVEQAVPNDCGSDIRIAYDCDSWTLEDFVQHVGECIDTTEDQDEWDAVDKEDAQEVVDFVNENWHYNADVYEIRKEERLSHITGAFLTKRACKEYIERYKYNHTNPKTYAMTAYRNFELGKLLKILKTIKLE